MVERILHVVKNFSPPSQTFIYDLVSRLERPEFAQEQVVAYYGRRFLKEARPFGKVVSIAKHRGFYGRFTRLIRFGGSVERERSAHLAQLIDRYNPQVIHAHFAWSLWDVVIPCALKHELNTPVLVSVHGTDILMSAKGSAAKRRALVEFSIDHIVLFAAANDFMARELEALGISRNKVIKIPNCIVESFASAEQVLKPRLTSKRLRVACVARLVACKGQRFLIQACADLWFKHRVDSEITLIGDGAERGSLELLVKKLEVEDRVHFLGFIGHEKVAGVLRENDLYVQPSILDPATGQCEAFGIAILEAISCGLPVIVTNSGGMPEVVGSENKFAKIVAPADSIALAYVIEEMYRSKVYTMDNSEYARERLGAFSNDQQMQRVQDAYCCLTESFKSVIK